MVLASPIYKNKRLIEKQRGAQIEKQEIIKKRGLINNKKICNPIIIIVGVVKHLQPVEPGLKFGGVIYFYYVVTCSTFQSFWGKGNASNRKCSMQMV